jgi:hypothetical protein
MKLNWHILAARLAAENPSWPWSKVCASLASRRLGRKRNAPPKITAQEYQARLEKLGLG